MGAGIDIVSLGKTWPDRTVALHDVTFSAAPAQVVAILGGSGAGKSTLLRCASGLIPATTGTVRMGDLSIVGSGAKRVRGRIGFVFQQFNLVKSDTALRNVLLGRLAHMPYLRGLVGMFRPMDYEVARGALEHVGMSDRADALVRDLSGGQQQRVAIARAFAQEPDALFADEPTASLDPRLADVVLTLLRDYGERHQVPVLVNVHTVEHARKYAHRVLGLRGGALVFDGPPDQLDEGVLETIYGPKDAA